MNRDLFAAAGGVVDATTDPYFNSTTLLLSGDGTNGAQNNTFVDSSVNNATITRTGTTTQGSFSPFSQTGWSGYFNGSTDYLSAPANTAFVFGTGDFTMEAWVYATALPIAPFGTIMGNGGNSNVTTNYSVIFYLSTTLYPSLYVGTSTTETIRITSSSAILINTWNHIAATRSGNTFTVWVNGVSSATGTSSVNLNTSQDLYIGRSYSDVASYYLTGYISNARILKGTALYTANFTPPTTPLTAVSGTSLLTLQSNRFKDNALTPNTITVSGTPSVQAFSPFAPTAAYSLPAAAAGSAYFNGSSNLLVPAGAPFNLTTVDFCIEMWVYPIAQSTYGALLSFDAQDYPLMFQWAAAGSANIRFYAGSSTAWISGTPLDFGTTVLNTWAHICVTRTSGVFRTFKNGVLSIVLAGQESYSIGDSVGSVYVGSNGAAGGFSTAYISNLRIIKGTGNVPPAYQTSSTTLGTAIFTPPTAPLTAVTGTSLLTLQDSTFKDNSVNVATITASSPAPVIQSFTPFTQVWGGYFNGSSYLTTPSNTAFQFGTEDFTIEAWINVPNFPTRGAIVNNRTSSAGSTTSWGIYHYTSKIFFGTPSTDYIGGGTTLVNNVWYHVTVTRSSGTLRLFLNGLSDATPVTGNTTNFSDTSAASIGIENILGGLYPFTGYISNLRIVKGVAVYTGAFTPPAKTLSATQAAGTNISAIIGTATSLLTLQDPTFKDNAILPNTITAAGTPKTQLVSAPFTSAATVDPVSGSGYFNGSTDYLTPSVNATLALGTGEFTIECWVYFTNSVANHGVFQLSTSLWPAATSGLAIYVSGGSGWGAYYNGTGNNGAPAPMVNTWYHVALVRSGTTTKLYVNGSQILTATDTTNYTGTYLSIGGYFGTAYLMSGYIANLRIVKGTAVYTAAFTPPSAPLTAITNTSLLTLQDTTFIDNSTNALAITAAGSPSMRAFTPFTQAWGGYFNGSSYLSVPKNTALEPATSGAWTIEFFCYTGSGSSQRPWTYGNATISSGPDLGTYFSLSGGGTVEGGFYSGVNATTVTGGTVLLNQWNHVALVSNGTMMTLYLNGISVGTPVNISGVAINAPSSATGRIGIYASTDYFNGYISNFRFVKGVAVYTGAFTPPTKTLSATQAAGTNISAIYPGQTSLLTLQDPTFKDNAAISNTITAVGTPKMQLISSLPFTSSATVDPVNGSGYFNGSTDYLSVPDNAAFEFGAGDFTLEGWFNFSSLPSTNGYQATLFAKWATGQPSYELYLYNSSGTYALYFTYSTNGSTAINIGPISFTPSLGVWYHIALCKNSTNLIFYVNGSQQGATQTLSAALFDSTAPMLVGSFSATANCYFNGYASNARVVKGTAVYTAAFQPPTAPLTAIANTSLLTLQDTTFKDNSTNALAITASGTPVMRAFTPFASNWGGYFASGGDYLTTPITASGPLDLGSGSWTVEAWVMYTGSSLTSGYRNFLTFCNNSGLPYLQFGTKTGTGYVFAEEGTQSAVPWSVAGTTLLTSNVWHHIATVRNGNNISIYLDGVLQGSITYSGTIQTFAKVQIGSLTYNGSVIQDWTGYISNARIVKGTAVYTTNFQPPSAPLTAITNTSLLTLQNNTFIDNSTNAATITAVGAPKTQLLQLPFTSSITKVAAPWSVYQVTKVAAPWNISVTAPLATVGGSMYFNGSGDYFTLPSNQSQFSMSTGDFTIEMWVYITSLASGRTLYDTLNGGDSTGTGRILIQVATGGTVQFVTGAGTTLTSGGTLIINSWYHVAVTKASGSTRIYVNGVQVNTTYADSNTYTVGTVNRPIIGVNAYDASTNPMLGYISNFRVTKGVAVYTGAFTPPAAPPQPTQTPGLLGTNVNAIDGTNTSLLLLGSNAGIYDATAKNDLVTVGNAQVSSTQIKYGTGAMYFDGTSGYLLGIATPQLVFGAGNFTIEYWLYINSTAQQGVFGMRPQTTNGVYPVMYFLSGTLRYNVSGTDRISASITTGTWYHVAVSRSGTSTKMFIDGTQAGSTYTDTSNYLCSILVIGADEYTLGGTVLNGYIDDLRVTKGIARYTTTFTPPTKAMIGQ